MGQPTERAIADGDQVAITYSAYSAAGGLIETSEGREPLLFLAGGPEVIPGISRVVIGMRQGERRRVAVQPEQAFGVRDSRLQQLTPKIGLPPRLEDGEQLTVTIDNKALDVWVRALVDEGAVLDANHPLAGETLVFDLEVVRHIPAAEKLPAKPMETVVPPIRAF